MSNESTNTVLNSLQHKHIILGLSYGFTLLYRDNEYWNSCTGTGIHCTLKTCTYLLELTKREVHGYAIGGLAGGESKDDFWKMVAVSAKSLPDNKPRYTMGIGFALDLVVCTALGSDMYDCVFPTRTAVSYRNAAPYFVFWRL